MSKGPNNEKSQVCTADAQLHFDLAGVTKRNLQRRAEDRSTMSKVIGRCELQPGQGMWLVIHEASIACFNAARYVMEYSCQLT